MSRNGVEAALRVAADHFGVSAADIRSQRRTSAVHPARLWAVYLAATTTPYSDEDIGAHVGRRDPGIVRMYVRNRARAVESDSNAALLNRLLRARLSAT